MLELAREGGAYLKGRLFRLSIFSLKMTLSLFLFRLFEGGAYYKFWALGGR